MKLVMKARLSDLLKAGDRTQLAVEKRQVNRGGKTFEQGFHVKGDETPAAPKTPPAPGESMFTKRPMPQHTLTTQDYKFVGTVAKLMGMTIPTRESQTADTLSAMKKRLDEGIGKGWKLRYGDINVMSQNLGTIVEKMNKQGGKGVVMKATDYLRRFKKYNPKLKRKTVLVNRRGSMVLQHVLTSGDTTDPQAPGVAKAMGVNTHPERKMVGGRHPHQQTYHVGRQARESAPDVFKVKARRLVIYGDNARNARENEYDGEIKRSGNNWEFRIGGGKWRKVYNKNLKDFERGTQFYTGFGKGERRFEVHIVKEVEGKKPQDAEPQMQTNYWKRREEKFLKRSAASKKAYATVQKRRSEEGKEPVAASNKSPESAIMEAALKDPFLRILSEHVRSALTSNSGKYVVESAKNVRVVNAGGGSTIKADLIVKLAPDFVKRAKAQFHFAYSPKSKTLKGGVEVKSVIPDGESK